MKHPTSMPLRNYAEVIKATGKKLGVPVLDLMENLGIDPNDPTDRANFTVDGLHFNDAGHEYIAKALEKFLKAL